MRYCQFDFHFLPTFTFMIAFSAASEKPMSTSFCGDSNAGFSSLLMNQPNLSLGHDKVMVPITCELLGRLRPTFSCDFLNCIASADFLLLFLLASWWLFHLMYWWNYLQTCWIVLLTFCQFFLQICSQFFFGFFLMAGNLFGLHVLRCFIKRIYEYCSDWQNIHTNKSLM